MNLWRNGVIAAEQSANGRAAIGTSFIAGNARCLSYPYGDAMKQTNAILDNELREDDPTIETATTVAKKYRVQLDFSPRDFQEIQSLVKELDLNTRAELFRSSLIALRWMVQKKRMGCSIVAITPEERYLEPEFEFLQKLGSYAPADSSEGELIGA